jgi:release factor glutamine methyltransferase
VSLAPLAATIAAATTTLTEAGVPSPRFDAEELAAFVLAVPRSQLARYELIDADRYNELIRERAQRRPLQHLTGVAHFRHVSLAVGPGVFVPRPETEVMVGQVLEFLSELDAPRVLDLGTGSGAIALAIATECSHAQVHAVETDPVAHDWAARNLAGSGVTLYLGDLATTAPELDGSLDVVVSNPPYIPLSAWESVTPEARDHDPPTALWGGGSDGLDAVRAVEERAARALRAGGLVAVEHADAQGDTAPAVFRATGRWRAVADHPDLAGRARFVTARRV